MFWRQTGKEYKQNKGTANKRAIKKIILSGEIPGLLAYDGDEPVAWCSVGPRERYSRLMRSRTLKPIDDQPVWSIVCLYVKKSRRDQGVGTQMLGAASEYAASQGVAIIEGYPNEPKNKWADAFLYTGTASAFRKAGFKKVAQPSPTRLIMRKQLNK
ncbi:MAG TPA: GNAT family N-acetyltransferase [candidate division Zixibacteria bacterium]|nr:GNAT family N-acetyltransferase [candidate division Zixibacteria bacterium]